MTAPTPPEPVGDWREWSAAQARALHPERDDAKLTDEIRNWLIDAPNIDWRYHEERYLSAVGYLEELVKQLDAARADADALRARLALTEAEQDMVRDARIWAHLSNEGLEKSSNVLYHVEKSDKYIDALLALMKRLTRDGGGR